MARRPVLLAGLALAAAAIGITCNPAAPRAQTAVDNGDGARLVAKIKTVADRGLLYDPRAMADVLQLKMRLSEVRKSLDLCRDGTPRTPTLITSGAFENGWYKPGPEGVQNMKFPQAFINPAGQVGAPSINYETYRYKRCNDGNYERIEAHLSFGGLSSYSCFTPDRLARLIGAQHRMATDGVSISGYDPPATDRYGVSVAFLFRMGAPCALDVSINQDTRTGHREQRAFANWRWCSVRADREFCRAHPNLKPEERERLSRNALAVCGTEEAFLEKEPLSGSPATPLPEVKYRDYREPPCRD